MPHRSIAHIISQQTPVTAPASITVREACQRMAAAKIGALLVVEHGFLTGIFTERDALNRVLAPGLDPEHTLLSEVMTANPRAVPPEKPLSYALHLMHIGGYRHMPVVQAGRPLGMVSVRDALGAEICDFERDLESLEKIATAL